MFDETEGVKNQKRRGVFSFVLAALLAGMIVSMLGLAAIVVPHLDGGLSVRLDLTIGKTVDQAAINKLTKGIPSATISMP